MKKSAVAMKPACEGSVAMCEPRHQEQGRDDPETELNWRLRLVGDASEQRTQEQHVVCVVGSARSWQTERPNMVWPPFDLVLVVSLRGSLMTTRNWMGDELEMSTVFLATPL